MLLCKSSTIIEDTMNTLKLSDRRNQFSAKEDCRHFDGLPSSVALQSAVMYTYMLKKRQRRRLFSMLDLFVCFWYVHSAHPAHIIFLHAEEQDKFSKFYLSKLVLEVINSVQQPSNKGIFFHTCCMYLSGTEILQKRVLYEQLKEKYLFIYHG